MMPHKRQHELIDFIDQVRSIDRDRSRRPWSVRSTITAATNRDSIDDRAESSRASNVHRLVTDEELFGWYRAASIYLSLSEHEGFGMPLIEAMAFDLPVVAYAAPGISDTLGHAGIAIADKAPATILDALIRPRDDRSFRLEVIRSQRDVCGGSAANGLRAN